jgi:glycosyltransferase involved in cell wall biosynthesis
MTPPRPSPLRVAVLADTVVGHAGMGRYAREVLRGLARRRDVELIPVVPRDNVSAVDALDLGDQAVDRIEVPGRTRVEHGLWERYRLGARLNRYAVDVVHGLKHLVPKTRLPTVLTVHDLVLLTWPQQADLAKRLLLPRQYRASLRSAQVLVAVSEATRQRLIAYDASFEAKTVTDPLGFSPELLAVDPVPVPELVDQRFALVVGDLSPRKNLGFLADLWPEIDAAAGGLRLAVVGPDGVRSGPTRRRVDDLVDRGLAVRPGRVSEGALRWCYEHARVVLLPTLEEGFGLPVLEAAVLGAPVVANPDPALVETGRGWPTFVDVSDRGGWIRAVVDASTTDRDRSRTAVAGSDTWDAHVSGLVDAYRRAVSTHR